MARYLTDKAQFRCGGGVFFSCSDKGQRKVFYNNSAVLTTAASLEPIGSPPAPCPILSASGATFFCQKNFSPWLKGVEGKAVLGHNGLLTDEVSVTCLATGQPVTLFSDAGNSAGRFKNGANVNLVGPAGEDASGTAAKPANGIFAGSIEAPASAPAGTRNASGGLARKMPGLTARSMEPMPEHDTSKESDKEQTLAYKCGDCNQSCKLKDTYAHKTPPWDEAPLDLGNDSKKLRANYLAELNRETWQQTPADSIFKEKEEETISGDDGKKLPKFRFQAHHLISGNQTFRGGTENSTNDNAGTVKFEHILRMAYVCDYDINNAYNCIMLVSDREEDDENQGLKLAKNTLNEKEGEWAEKSANAYTTMRDAKIQWHVGNHSYSFEEKTRDAIVSRVKFYTKKDAMLKTDGKNGGALKTYIDLLREEIEKIDQRIEKNIDDGKKICPRAFREQMDKLSAKIRESLEKFSEGYHSSYPWYVSKQAFLFAFQLPQTFKIITVNREADRITLKKFRISRKMSDKKNEEITVAPLETSGTNGIRAELTYPLARYLAEKEKIICFCSNIEFFLFFGRCGKGALPFKIEKKYFRKVSDGKTSIEAYLKERAYAILVWIRDLQSRDYIAPLARIHERMSHRPNIEK